MGEDSPKRVDHFYELVNSGQWESLNGLSTEAVLSLLGPPSEVWELEHEGHLWRRIVYRFDAPPTRATEEELRAIGTGMEFTPTLLFRDDICVPRTRYDAEVPTERATAGQPRSPAW